AFRIKFSLLISVNEGGDDGEITFLNGIKVTTVGSATVPEPCFLTGSSHQKAYGCFLRQPILAESA
ncbi:hypothetical protein D6Q01_27390, partial [Salmonella enterica subsp. enterica]|nr:hypothetical protein [Salmonella enterica subsp. enterica]